MSLVSEIQEIAKQYPESRSAIMPALHLAQKQYGWLPREALEQVGEALDLTPAYCMSVASFYDMYHLEPVGKHTIEVCTNISCALVGAQATLEAFERELGIHPGETTADGEITLRTVECYGGCGWGPVVAVDQRYHEPVKPEDVAHLLQGLRDA